MSGLIGRERLYGKGFIETSESPGRQAAGAFIDRYGKHDPDYDEAMSRVVELRDRYEGMELRPEDRETINSMLDGLDDVEEAQVNLAYLAGLADCLLILDRLELFQL